MTNFDESLSAVFDGECSHAELDRLLDACGRSPELMRRYGRYSASHEASSGTVFNFDSEALCASVMSQIDPPRRARVLAFRTRARAVLRPVGGLALAASVGALATFAVYRAGGPVLPQAAPVAQTASNTVNASPADGGNAVASAAPVSEPRWSQLDPSAARQLDDYMMEHASYRSEQGMGSALNYARMATQDIQYRAVDGSH